MFFSRVRPDHSRCRSTTWICMCRHTRDPVIYSKFYRNPFRGFGAPGGQNLAFPITLASRFYNSLYYCTSRDLGVYIVLAMKFKCSIDHAKRSFYTVLQIVFCQSR